MPRLLVREQADMDVDQIFATIAQDNLSAALRFYDRVRETYDRVATWPLIGTRRRARDLSLRGLRSYPIRGYRTYLVFYLPMDDGAEIIHVIHGARDIPSVLRSE
ncbi:MAG: type II toxin-antitoxin system RelE/ParE family toxin [Planctomycetota bacterium]|nr:type II toxin-antitoxin system RelE/ParE family toxin [Planctomycetota bacterium]